MDKSKAFEIFDVNEKYTEKEVKDKFKVFQTKYKKGEDIDMEQITAAYNLLLGFEEYEKLDKNSRSYKFRKFLFNYLSYILIFLGIGAVIAWLVIPKITYVAPDLSITYVGNYYQLDSQEMEELLYNNIDDLEKVMIEIIYLDENTTDASYDEAGRVRLGGTIISKEADIFILDDENYRFLMVNEILTPLDEIIPKLDVDFKEDQYIYALDPKTREKRIYGIDVGKNGRIIKTAYGNVIRIFSIAKDSEHMDKVIEAANLILKEE